MQSQHSAQAYQVALPPLDFLLDMQHRFWQHHHSISASINHLICKHFLIDSSFDERKLLCSMQSIDTFIRCQLREKGVNRVRVLEWINSILFNVAAMNQDYEQQLSHSLSGSSNKSNSKAKHDESLHLIQNFQETQKNCFKSLLEISSIVSLIEEFEELNTEQQKNEKKSNSQRTAEHEIQFTMMSTIQYLCSKMQINPKYLEILGYKLDLLASCCCGCKREVAGVEEEIRNRVNLFLFGQDSGNGIVNALKSNYNGNLQAIASLVDANYYREEPTRPIFSGAVQTGMEITYWMIGRLTQAPKNTIFSEQMLESNQICRLFMSIIEYRHLNLYANWLQFLEVHLSGKLKTNTLSQQLVSFFYHILVENVDFVQLLRLTGKQLLKKNKCTQTMAIEIIKKLVLNRFLLSPQLFFKYTAFSIPESTISTSFNQIRLLFYPKKASNPQMISSSSKIQGIFTNIVFPHDQLELKSEPGSKCVIYRLDQSLKSDYEVIHEDYLSKEASEYKTNRVNGHGMSNSEYSLSFSFVKSPKQTANPKTQKPTRTKQQTLKNQSSPQSPFSQNCSLQTILYKTNRPDWQTQKKQQQIRSPGSQKSRKTVLTQHTDIPSQLDLQITMLEQLVEKRRMLGLARRKMEKRKKWRESQREKLGYFLAKVHCDFQKWRRELENSANRVRIQVDLL